MQPGTRVRLTHDVERYPHFIAPSGSTGTVVQFDADHVAVKLDDPLEGAEEWDNEVHWYPEHGDARDVLEVIPSD